MRKVLPTVLTGYVIFFVLLLIDNAPAEAFQGLNILAVIVTIASSLLVRAVRRQMITSRNRAYNIPKSAIPAPEVFDGVVVDENAGLLSDSGSAFYWKPRGGWVDHFYCDAHRGAAWHALGGTENGGRWDHTYTCTKCGHTSKDES